MRAVAERVSQGGGVFGEGFQIVDFKGEVREIGADLNGAALVELANFDERFAAGGLEEDEVRPAPAHAAADFFETEDVCVERNCAFEIGNSIARMEELRDHEKSFRGRRARCRSRKWHPQNNGGEYAVLIGVCG